jgi:hypothetical protein
MAGLRQDVVTYQTGNLNAHVPRTQRLGRKRPSNKHTVAADSCNRNFFKSSNYFILLSELMQTGIQSEMRKKHNRKEEKED